MVINGQYIYNNVYLLSSVLCLTTFNCTNRQLSIVQTDNLQLYKPIPDIELHYSYYKYILDALRSKLFTFSLPQQNLKCDNQAL